MYPYGDTEPVSMAAARAVHYLCRVGLRSDLAEGADEVRETHISWVFLDATSAYKVKKPVSLGFLDFSTLEQRRRACEAEVALNARLAPDVYLGVCEVVRDAAGRHRIGGEGAVVDYAVHMRRLSDEDRAEHRLATGVLEIADVDRMAGAIAAFHASARCDDETARYGRPEVVGGNVRENFAQTRAVIETLLSHDEAEEIERWQLDFLRRREALLLSRIERGRVRDGHGDLRLEHVYLEGDELRIIDCIEFAERFRHADVCADLAFLSMDLAWHGRVDLAERLLATYARETSDFELYAVVDFYESYRAYVRGKVATILAADEGAPAPLRARARREARRYFLLALAAERRSLMAPMVVAVGGGLAAGKSTLADALSARMGAPAINSDRVRKHMLGARPTERVYEGSWSGAYDPRVTEAVYEEVNRGARAVVRSGRPVILDATFRSRAQRARARALAEELGVPFLLIECRAASDVCRARLVERERAESVSDGRLEIYDEFMARWEPVVELPPSEHLVVHTDRPMDGVLAGLEPRLPFWPDGLEG
jgi:aminoglycoside phosphotransferase family enzyme/predicted kinase